MWQGDITQLNGDAIVNAANKYMLGCFQPLHACIDNAIHSAAGPQLREDCETIMSIQAELEITGGAKITRGYNLPSKFVLHTVGPIVFGFPKTEAAIIAVTTVNEWLDRHSHHFEKIIFNVFSDGDYKDYLKVFQP